MGSHSAQGRKNAKFTMCCIVQQVVGYENYCLVTTTGISNHDFKPIKTLMPPTFQVVYVFAFYDGWDAAFEPDLGSSANTKYALV